MNRLPIHPLTSTLSAPDLLEDHTRARQHLQELGIRPLSPVVKGVIWSLRVYVLFMIVVVVINVVQTTH